MRNILKRFVIYVTKYSDQERNIILTNQSNRKIAGILITFNDPKCYYRHKVGLETQCVNRFAIEAK